MNASQPSLKILSKKPLLPRFFGELAGAAELVTVVRFFFYTPLYIDSTEGSLRSALLLGKNYSPLINRICMGPAGV